MWWTGPQFIFSSEGVGGCRSGSRARIELRTRQRGYHLSCLKMCVFACVCVCVWREREKQRSRFAGSQTEIDTHIHLLARARRTFQLFEKHVEKFVSGQKFTHHIQSTLQVVFHDYSWLYVCMCVCVCARARQPVCVHVRASRGGRVCKRVGERERECVCVPTRPLVCVCVSVQNISDIQYSCAMFLCVHYLASIALHIIQRIKILLVIFLRKL